MTRGPFFLFPFQSPETRRKGEEENEEKNKQRRGKREKTRKSGFCDAFGKKSRFEETIRYPLSGNWRSGFQSVVTENRPSKQSTRCFHRLYFSELVAIKRSKKEEEKRRRKEEKKRGEEKRRRRGPKEIEGSTSSRFTIKES